MKILLHLICFLLFSLIVYSQRLNVHKSDGTVQNFNLSQIDSLTFSFPTPCPSTLSYAGKTYNTVQIGTQCWLKENLDVGTMIQGSQDQSSNGVIEKYCYFNVPDNCNIYGGLYQWAEAMQYVTTPGAKGICPSGWHVPTFAEFQILVTTVGNDGNALKAVGQGTGAGAGTNTSGFSALLAGYRQLNGTFSNLGNWAYFYSSVYDYSPAYALPMSLEKWGSAIGMGGGSDALQGYSIRCLKDIY